MSTYKDPWDKMQQDPAFKRLVDMMFYCISQGEYTPSEIRQAAILATTQWERYNPRPLIFTRVP